MPFGHYVVYFNPNLSNDVYRLLSDSTRPSHIPHAMFWILIVNLLCGCVLGETCRQVFTHRPLLGVRCITATQIYSHSRPIPHTCIHMCIRKPKCTIANYYMASNTCFLSNETSIALRADTEFYVSTLRSMQHRQQCFRWVPVVELNEASTFYSTECYKAPLLSIKPCHLGRLVYFNNILPGKYMPHISELHSVLNGKKLEDGDIEIFDFDNGCPTVWMSFTAGNDIPDVAVKGRYLADSSTELYVMRAVYSDHDLLMFGYYDPLSALGYLASGGAKEITQMELL